jgi:PKD repeat protein
MTLRVLLPPPGTRSPHRTRRATCAGLDILSNVTGYGVIAQAFEQVIRHVEAITLWLIHSSTRRLKATLRAVRMMRSIHPFAAVMDEEGLMNDTLSGSGQRLTPASRIWLALAVAVVAFVLVPSARATTNVVPNPGFEQGGCGSTPVICGWTQEAGLMSQATGNAHSGSASMSLYCGPTGCYASGGSASLSAQTDPAFCAAIGPGVHPASFWYRAGPEGASVILGAVFSQAPDCTGTGSGDFFGDVASGDDAWHEASGDVHAPPGTESALFYIGVNYPCDDFCGIGASFDDLDVEDTVVPDTTPPETTITAGPSGTTDDSSALLEFTASEPSSFECSLDSGPFAICSSPAFYAGLSEGAHTFRVRATDAAGNTDPTPAERSWTVGVPPQTTIISGPSGTTNSTSATFEFAASEPSTFECSLDSAPFAACSSPAFYTGLSEGSHTFRVRATDAAGNTDPTPAQRTWIVQTNAPPVASFTFSCSALSCSFDASASSDPDGSIASYAWNFGDGTSGSGSTADHSYAQAVAYVVTLTVTDDAGATGSDSKTLTLISLSARGYKVKGLQKVDLSWSGPSGGSFDVYRNGARIAAVQAGAYTDDINRRGSGTYTYKVCAAGVSVCSNAASVVF